MGAVTIKNVRKVFANDTVAVDDVSLDIKKGEFVVLLGASGCGKTTLLRMIAGLETVTEGEILIADRSVTHVHPADRDVAMVFQSYALYPHMSVYKNLAYGLKRRGTPRKEITGRVKEAADLLEIGHLLDRLPSQLSGGQRQRVALGRAIVRHPSAFLLDEPLSNLDAKLRVQMRNELMRLHQRLGVTTVYVTHDQVEAMTMGERVVIMDGGRVQQIGTPLELYERPANKFVATFLGTPQMNTVRGRLDAETFTGEGISFPLTAAGGEEPLDVVVGLRPHHLWGSVDVAPGRLRVARGQIEFVEHLGSESFAFVRAGATTLTVEIEVGRPYAAGDALELSILPEHVHVFDAESGARMPIALGKKGEVAVGNHG